MQMLQSTRCYILDMDGTFYLGDRLVDGALHLVEVLETQGKAFLFLTNNSSKDRRIYVDKIARLGLEIPEDKVFTSGEATALFLTRNYPDSSLYVVGTPSLEDEFRQHGFRLDDEQPDVAVLGFDTTLTYDKLWKLCDFVREGLPYIATHPDLNCPIDDGFMPDIGAMIAFVRASTGREPDHVVGKPNPTIIEMISEKLGLPIEQLAMVGDRLYTDIACGTTTGITTILVLSGETKREDLEGSPFQPSLIFENLGELAEYLMAKGRE
jgi:4-nitrophenyl phosphatase/NagD protein